MIRFHLKQQSRCEKQNVLGIVKEKICKNSLLVAISVCLLSVRKYELDSHAKFVFLMAVFFGGFESSGT